MKIKTLEELEQLKKQGLESLESDKITLAVGTASCGRACGAMEVLKELQAAANDQVAVTETGCIGFCEREAMVSVKLPHGPMILYPDMTGPKATELLQRVLQGQFEEGALCKISNGNGNGNGYAQAVAKIPEQQEIPFYRKQQKIAMRNCGYINPDHIEEYIARGGYFALYKILQEGDPEGVIEQVRESGLKGRGGGGFLTGRKWASCRHAPGERKFIICNADEGDPGAYMDRSILEGDPHSVIEGMIIGGYAIGSSEGFIYVRNEYPLAIQRLNTALAQAYEYGLLGKNIFGTGFNFNIQINRGGGAFVCGESTALMASLEGKVGEPRAKYIHTVEKGLWDLPSNLNNVETWANIPPIISQGAQWFNQIGSKGNTGTKVFSLVGNITNTGLIEVPMGTTLKEIIYEIGGGIPNNKKFKAVQTGGPSGGCIPEQFLHLPVDFDELWKIGSMMGSGGMIIMDENTCMVDVARYFLEFLQEESCGKCVPCREGIKRLGEILNRICAGEGREGDIELLEELSHTIKDSSLCQLGGSAPNPLLTTLKYFREEYEAHIKDKKCPAGICTALIEYKIDPEKCKGCTACIRVCPNWAIMGEKKQPHTIDPKRCIKCGMCKETCKFDAIYVA